jgi:hypothetical protein
MPINDRDVDGGNDPVTFRALLGVSAPAPATTTAVPLLGAAQLVSSTPSPGQGVALTAVGVLPPSAAATGLRMLTADPASPLTGEFWYRTDLDKLCQKTATGVKRSAAFT